MENITDASNVLATCYPLRGLPEEHASHLGDSQKRRDTTNPPSQDKNLLGNALTLRPYQALAVQNLRSALAGGASRVMLCSATGSGKTEIGMALVKGALAKGELVALLSNRIHLVEQTSRRFTKTGIGHGIIQGTYTTRIYEND